MQKLKNASAKEKQVERKYVTTEQLVQLLENFNDLFPTGVTFASVAYMTNVSESKKVNGANLLKKFVKLNVTLGSDYENKVKRVLEQKQGQNVDFVAQGLNGLVHYKEGTPLLMDIKTNEKRYLQFIAENNANISDYKIFIAETMQEVNKADVWNEEYLTASGLKKGEYTVGRGAVDKENEFHIRSLDIKNIKELRMGGIQYVVIA